MKYDEIGLDFKFQASMVNAEVPCSVSASDEFEPCSASASFIVLSALGLELSKIARFAKSATPASLSH